MLPVEFKYRLMYLGKPADMTDEECTSLPVWHDGERYVSCWKLNAEELKQIQETGTLYIMVTGAGHPPIYPCIECPVEGEFNIKTGQVITAKLSGKHPGISHNDDGTPHIITGHVIEKDGTYYVETAHGFVLLAYCQEITIIDA